MAQKMGALKYLVTHLKVAVITGISVAIISIGFHRLTGEFIGTETWSSLGIIIYVLILEFYYKATKKFLGQKKNGKNDESNQK